MPDVETIPPARRSELLLRPLGEKGQCVVKDPATGEYFHLGEEEYFLLEELDGEKPCDSICAAFEGRFGAPLAADELAEFVELARVNGFLEPVGLPAKARGEQAPPDAERQSDRTDRRSGPRARQSVLYWRKGLFDPDRLFNWLFPRLWFLWTRAFFIISALCILVAVVVVWTNGSELVTYFAGILRWETLVLAWLTMIAVTTCHEFAHGLTCKRYGGEVHEIGFLLLFFMPCFYCNVSDAWLFREKSKRLWVTLAGGYCDLFLWSLAVFIWRLTYQDSLVNYLSWVVLSICGIRVFFNFNPLLKLDGYYLLSDLVEIPNMRQRALACVMGNLRWLLWGAPRPAAEPRATFLMGYGLACWLFSLLFISLMLVALGRYLGTYLGLVGVGITAYLGLMVSRILLHGLFSGELTKMIFKRHKRTALWLTGLAGVIAVLALVPMADRASGTFEVRPVTRAELRAPIAGFLQAVYYDEGQNVAAGAVVALLEVPDLPSRIAQKAAQVREAEARLRLLRAGPRPEEVVEQRCRVKRGQAWRDLAQQDLERQKQALEEELARFDNLLSQYRAERDYCKQVVARSEILHQDNSTMSEDEYQKALKEYLVYCAQCEQTLAGKRARQALGTLKAEAELGQREKELADQQSTLALLEAGTRPEEIQAAEANSARLKEEAHYLRQLEQRLSLYSPVPGWVITPRLKEKVGHYFEEGDLVCEIEDPELLEVEIELTEDEAERVLPGQTVRLKARALPFEVFEAEVERIAPKAISGDFQSTVTVYCKIQGPTAQLRSGMTGYARIDCSRGPIGVVLARRCLRLIRTEFWW